MFSFHWITERFVTKWQRCLFSLPFRMNSRGSAMVVALPLAVASAASASPAHSDSPDSPVAVPRSPECRQRQRSASLVSTVPAPQCSVRSTICILDLVHCCCYLQLASAALLYLVSPPPPPTFAAAAAPCRAAVAVAVAGAAAEIAPVGREIDLVAMTNDVRVSGRGATTRGGHMSRAARRASPAPVLR